MSSSSGAVAVAVGAVVLLGLRARNGAPRYVTAPVDRGDIAEVVGATGALQAVTTVQVGSQVSGTIASLNADFNSVVKKGQVVARLDPSLFEARLGAGRRRTSSPREANVRAHAGRRSDAKQKYARAQELAEEQLLPQSGPRDRQGELHGAVAQIQANEAAVSQAAGERQPGAGGPRPHRHRRADRRRRDRPQRRRRARPWRRRSRRRRSS